MEEQHHMYYHISDLQKTFEKAYQDGFRDGIEFVIRISKDEKILRVFKDGNILT